MTKLKPVKGHVEPITEKCVGMIEEWNTVYDDGEWRNQMRWFIASVDLKKKMYYYYEISEDLMSSEPESCEIHKIKGLNYGWEPRDVPSAWNVFRKPTRSELDKVRKAILGLPQ